ncbi:MAG: hypothetical protein ACYS9C_04080 [Planctomycetota bacterium]
MWWQEDRADGALVDDVEDTSASRDHRAHAGEVLVAPGIPGTARPAQTLRRTSQRIIRYRVVRGIIEVVAPLVQFPRPILPHDLNL